MSWRDNPNLVECFENCVAMFHGMPAVRPASERESWVVEVKRRRQALGLSQEALSLALGRSRQHVAGFESGVYGGKGRYERIVDTLARLEAERAQP